jgi:hypothetical protein
MPPAPQNQAPSSAGVRALSYFKSKRLISARVHEFDIIDKFSYGYRNREDQTNLPASVLVVGSQNVLTNVAERIQARAGYVLDGSASSVASPIDSSYNTNMVLSGERNLRSYFATPGNASSGVLQYRYVDANGTVTWRNLLSSLTGTKFNYTLWWDKNETLNEILMVNGTANVFEWGGGITTIASVTNNTITTTGTKTWAQLGFYASNSSHATRKITINGVDYTYTGGETTTTLTGVSPGPVGSVNVGDIAHQTPITTASASLTSMNLAQNDLIQASNRQLWLGSLNDQTIYVSKINNYKDFSLSSTNVSGFGQQFQLDAAPVAFINLENAFTISAGHSQWYQITLATSTYTDNSNPAAPVVYNVDTWTVARLKTNDNAAAQSQAMVSAMKNDVIFISREPTLDTLGRVEQILGTTQTTNMSDPIKLDFDSYDFTGASIFYNRYFIYIAIPKAGIVRIYNIVKSYWEAPQTIPVTSFYTVNEVLYGHSSTTAESYQLFTGRADRVDPVTNPLGNAFLINATFSYQNYGSPFTLKNFNKFYVEGYISSNTNLTLGITYDINGCATPTKYTINGNNSQYVCLGTGSGTKDDASLGKQPLGKYPLGGNIDVSGGNVLPPKFRIIQTFPRLDFFEVQYSFSTNSPNQNFEILRFGPAMDYSMNIPTSIEV